MISIGIKLPEENMVDETVWKSETIWVCPICGCKVPDDKICVTWRDSTREYDFSKCPNCGTQSIIPREYW